MSYENKGIIDDNGVCLGCNNEADYCKCDEDEVADYEDFKYHTYVDDHLDSLNGSHNDD